MASFGAQGLSGLCWAYLMSRHLAAMTGNSSIFLLHQERKASFRQWQPRLGVSGGSSPTSSAGVLAANLLTGHLSAPPPGSNSDYLVILAVLPKAAAFGC